MVAEARVTVNGRTATPTTPVEEGDAVTLDGKPVAIESRPLPRLFMLHKPLDVLVTNRDPKGRPTVFDLDALKPPRWSAAMPRVMSVGRLDVNSEGLLLLSSDGPLAQAMMSPKTALARVYRVRIHGRLTPRNIEDLAQGITVDGVNYRGAEFVEEFDKGGRSNTWYRVLLTEGKESRDPQAGGTLWRQGESADPGPVRTLPSGRPEGGRAARGSARTGPPPADVPLGKGRGSGPRLGRSSHRQHCSKRLPNSAAFGIPRPLSGAGAGRT